jgi:hypothetical protein
LIFFFISDYMTMQDGAGQCTMVQDNTGQARTMQNSAGQDRTLQDSADQCRMLRLDILPSLEDVYWFHTAVVEVAG